MNPQKIVNRLQDKLANIIQFAGHKMIVDAAGALIWPAKRLLIVSDCHFEKASFLGTYANPIPHYDSLKTLQALSELIEFYQPQQVVCLGDSFHDNQAWSRLSEPEKNALVSLVQSRQQWLWILGNHDPELPAELPGVSAEQKLIDNIVFVHEPLEKDSTPSAQIFGHFHPKMRKTVARHRMTGKCFMYDNEKLVMPSFGAFTGGLSIDDEVMKSLFDVKRANKQLIFQGKIHSF